MHITSRKLKNIRRLTTDGIRSNQISQFVFSISNFQVRLLRVGNGKESHDAIFCEESPRGSYKNNTQYSGYYG